MAVSIYNIPKRGKRVGTKLTPHWYQDGYYAVSKTKWPEDYIKETDPRKLAMWIAKGFGLRMSDGKGPSFISPKSIVVE
jgi:hypothetical protein